MLCKVLVFIAVANVAMAAVYVMPLEEKPAEYADCDGCWISADQLFVPINQTYPISGKCEAYHCTSYDVQIFSCDPVAVAGTCYVTTDPSLDYPDCCPKGVCPTSD